MAEKIKFRRGLSTALPSDKVAGTFLVETDTGTMYVDDSTTKRVQIKDNTKLSIDGTAKKAESDSNGNSLTDRITTLDTNESTGVVTLKNEKGETKGTVVNSSYVDTALSDKLDKTNPTGTGSFSLNRKANTTIGNHSFAEGSDNTASGESSHAEGYNTTASSNYQHVQGKYNIEDSSNTYADIIGNGTDDAARSNAATVDWSGNAWYAGDVYVGSTSGTNKDSGSKRLAPQKEIEDGTIVAGKASKDANGNVINKTYATKANISTDIQLKSLAHKNIMDYISVPQTGQYTGIADYLVKNAHKIYGGMYRVYIPNNAVFTDVPAKNVTYWGFVDITSVNRTAKTIYGYCYLFGDHQHFWAKYIGNSTVGRWIQLDNVGSSSASIDDGSIG